MDLKRGESIFENDQELIDKFLSNTLSDEENKLFNLRLKVTSFVSQLEETKELQKTITTSDMLSKLNMLKELEDSMGKNGGSSDD